jgi:hypothetical protein
MKNIQAIVVSSYVIVVIFVMDYVFFAILAPAHWEKGKLDTSMGYGVPHIQEIVIFVIGEGRKNRTETLVVPLVCI